MPIVSACAASHAPGITVWAEAASKVPSAAVNGGYGALAGLPAWIGLAAIMGPRSPARIVAGEQVAA